MMQALDHDRIRRVATEARVFLEPLWDTVRTDNHKRLPRGKAISHDMCRFSAAFLARVLEVEIPGEEWMVVGGVPTDGVDVDPDMGTPGGYRDTKGRWRAHYWVTDGGFGVVVDITADQFAGGEAVTVDEDDSRHRANYRDDAVENHLRDVNWRVGCWLETWDTTRQSGWSAQGMQPPPPR
jgi:hypothetical protein